jgi:enolase
MPAKDAITNVWAREVLNFRGSPTVEAEVTLSDGSTGRGAVAAGVSAGSHEVGQLLDGDPKRFRGKGVLKAVDNVRNIIAPVLKGMRASDQEAVDRRMLELDGTPNKKRLGANAILAVSIASAQAAAASKKVPLYRHLGGDGPFRLPIPTYDILCGGSHADEGVDFQEYLVIPVGVPTYEAALRAGYDVYVTLWELLRKRGHRLRDWGGPLAPSLGSNKEAMEVVMEAVEKAGYKLGEEVYVGIDAAMSELYEDGKYVLKRDGRKLTSAEMADLWVEWLGKYPIVSIEDAMSEDDWDAWQALTKRIGNRVQLVGDDFFTTNPERVRQGIQKKAANAVLIKPNQIGSISETLETIRTACKAGWGAMVSARSGEPDDSTIADLAMFESTGQIKMGPPCRQCIIKYNRLLRIAEGLGDKAEYAGRRAYRTWNR